MLSETAKKALWDDAASSYKREKYAEAYDKFQRFVEASPNHPGGWLYLGLSAYYDSLRLRYTGDLASAKTRREQVARCLNKALSLSDDPFVVNQANFVLEDLRRAG